MKLPETVRSTGKSPVFDRDSVPDALLSHHATAGGNWARLSVLEGELRYVQLADGAEHRVAAGSSRIIPPHEEHRVALGEGTVFQLEFFRETGD
jgi:tellurite resistance-related uncharacterized protein